MLNLLEQFLEYLLSTKGASINTIKAYEQDIKYFLIKIKSNKKSITEISKNDCKHFFLSLNTDNDALSNKSIARKISSIKHFFSFLHSENIIAVNPMIDFSQIKIAHKIPYVLSVKQMQELLEQKSNIHKKADVRLFAIISLLYSTGIRISELLSIQLTDILIDNNNLRTEFYVKGKGGKERIVLIDGTTKSILSKYIEIRCEFLGNKKHNKYLFCRPNTSKSITRQTVFLAIKKIAANMNMSDKISPHTFRHSFATHLLSNGADLRSIQDLLGHTDINTTQIYTTISKDDLHTVVKNKHPLGGSSGRVK